MSYIKTDFETKAENYLKKYLEDKGATVTLHPDHQFDDWDIMAVFPNNLTYLIELKARKQLEQDLLIEIIEDLKTGDIGWWYQTKANLVVYLFYKNESDNSPAKMYKLPVEKAKVYFLENAKELFRNSNISIKGYGTTLSVFLPLTLAEESIISELPTTQREENTEPISEEETDRIIIEIDNQRNVTT